MGLSVIPNLWRYDLSFPCPVTNIVNSGKTGIFFLVVYSSLTGNKLSSACFLKSVAHHNICTCLVSGQLKYNEKTDVQPCSDCNSNPRSQRLNKLSAIDHSDTDRRKDCFLTIVKTDPEPGFVKWTIVQQLAAGQCAEGKAVNITQHSFC